MRRVVLAIIGLLSGGLCPLASPAQGPARGVVVYDVTDGSAFAEAGIRREDVILAWRRLPSPPANPEEASGEIASAFDYMWFALEQAPRGEVELTVERGGEVRLVRVAAGEWSSSLVPRMPNPLLADYLLGKVELKAAAAERLWIEVAEGSADWRLRCWMVMAAGIGHEDWDKAHAVLSGALEEAEEPFPRSVIWRVIGRGYEQRGELELAREAYDSARELREKAAGESLAVAEILEDLATLAWDRRQASRAVDLYQRALEIYKKLTPRSPEIALIMHNLGVIALQRGDPHQAETLLQDAQRMTRQSAPESADDAMTLTNLGIGAARRGDLEQANGYHRARWRSARGRHRVAGL